MPAEGVFQLGQVASEELNAISEPNLAFRTQNNEECGPSGTSPGTYADRKTLLDRFVEANCGNEEKKKEELTNRRSRPASAPQTRTNNVPIRAGGWARR